MIAIVADSATQLPDGLRERWSVSVVPQTVVVNGRPYLEGIELSEVDVLAALEHGSTISTAAPSPGSFLQLYRRLAEQGAEEIVSVHVGGNVSGTFNIARLAADEAPVAIHLVDTRSGTFGATCCIRAAAAAIADGSDGASAASAARAAIQRIHDVFVIGSASLLFAGGRIQEVASSQMNSAAADSSIDVWYRNAGAPSLLGRADRKGLVQLISQPFRRDASQGVSFAGVGAVAADDAANEIANALREYRPQCEVIRHSIPPSIIAHTGLGTVSLSYIA